MLEHLFGSTTRVKLLQIFFRSPERPFYVRELSRMAETQLNAVRRELLNLVNLSIVEQVEVKVKAGVRGTERSKFYQLNNGSMLYSELKDLLLKAQLLEEQAFIEQIKTRVGELKLFMLTGIFTGEVEVGTDLLLVGKIKPLVLAKIIKDYELEAGKSVRYTILDEDEFNERRKIGDKFLFGILEAKHLTPLDSYRLN